LLKDRLYNANRKTLIVMDAPFSGKYWNNFRETLHQNSLSFCDNLDMIASSEKNMLFFGDYIDGQPFSFTDFFFDRFLKGYTVKDA